GRRRRSRGTAGRRGTRTARSTHRTPSRPAWPRWPARPGRPGGGRRRGRGPGRRAVTSRWRSKGAEPATERPGPPPAMPSVLVEPECRHERLLGDLDAADHLHLLLAFLLLLQELALAGDVTAVAL